MILHICETCGAWSDVSLAEAWAKAWEPVGKAFAIGLAQAYNLKIEEQPEEKPAGWPCPANAEHGNMRAVGSEDRLFLRPAIVEATAEECTAGGSHEQEESEKRQQLIDEIGKLAGRRLGLIGMNDVKHASTARIQELLATVKENAQYL